MGKSTSCFNIITCGKDSADNDDLEAPESKSSSDRCGWSFGKRSARHRVLSNTVITESLTSGHKEIPESAALNFQPPASTTVPEKISVIHCTDEKPQLVTPENLKVSETEQKVSQTEPKVPETEPKVPETEPKVSNTENVVEHESAVKCKPDESDVSVVQTASGGLLAQKSFMELENVVKLQAAVRGHLVRRHAVGTLRCVQALAKMQALVRARHARQEIDHNSKISEKEKSVAKSNVTYTSIEKLLRNSFARQLLESSPKTKPLHVMCDSSKPGSTWQWMERWTSLSSPSTVDIAESEKAVLAMEKQVRRKEEITEPPEESKIQDEVLCEISDSKSSITESIVPSESEENLITYDADNLSFQASHSNIEQPQLQNISISDVKEITEEINYLPNQSVQSNADSQVDLKSISGKPVTETEQPKLSMKRLASEDLETDGNKSVFGSRKVSNPAFIAAQSKFEVLSSTTNSGRSISASHQDDAVSELQRNAFSSAVDAEIRKELNEAENSLNEAENSVTHVSSVQVGGSECGTEISISSTLDSPDRSDVGATEHERGPKANSTENVDVQAKDSPTIPVSNLSDLVLDQPEKVVNGEIENSVVAVNSPQTESQQERTTSDLQREQDTEAGIEAYVSSPEGSPRSHLTVPESQGTPSSLVSMKAKKSKADKSGSNQKRKSASAGKKSPSNPNHDSGSSKDQKNGKRRNSFGSAKPAADNIDQEPRDSSSNSSIPHFMQATESARAKLQANLSPRSSPDMQDRDIYVKKRHSLPGTNGRQGSPRIQRTMSQAQPGAKTNERKWNR